ncbi:MAG: cyclic nucleotide-binding domain-containing protein [Pseudomonadales bacterium]|nr:cyclic nucleotide-binding domain-containing protein [Pseudomonadales bacterium]
MGKLMLQMQLNLIRKIDFLTTMSEHALKQLLSDCDSKTLEQGEVLFREGDNGTSMFVVLVGCLQVSKGTFIIAQRSAGDYIGEMALIEANPRSATVQATLPTTLLEISQQQFQDQFASNPTALTAIMKTLVNRARENLKIFDAPSDTTGASINKVSSNISSNNPASTTTPLFARADIGAGTRTGAHNTHEQHLKYVMQEAGLTHREADVARLICEGLSDKVIAKNLKLSPYTVRDHLKKIYSKFDVNARSQLVSLVHK